MGLGLDLCPIDRMEQAIGRHGDRFVERIFTALETSHCNKAGRPFECMAGRFAAKEAASKALGAPKGIGWHDVEVVPAVSGARGPQVILRGRAREVADERGVTSMMISITHAAGMAAAVAVAVG